MSHEASWEAQLQNRLGSLLRDLMLIPGLSGHEGRVRRHLKGLLHELGLEGRTDRVGNLIVTVEGTHDGPTVMLFGHMDQVGFFVRRIEPNGLLRLERLGGIPERVLAGTPVLLCVGEGRDVSGVIGSKSNHVLAEHEKYEVQRLADLFVDIGLSSADEVRAKGIDVGTPVVYEPAARQLGGTCMAGTSIDDRGACAVLVETLRELRDLPARPTTHFVFSVQEEFNVRGAFIAAQALKPDIAVQLDITIASDTPDLAHLGEAMLGRGPVVSMYNFHGRGTLNGVIPHPALTGLFARAAEQENIPVQKSAVVGLLTDGAYVQLAGEGVASIDIAYPARYAHSPNEVCDLRDLSNLTLLLLAALGSIDADFSLDRDDYIS